MGKFIPGQEVMFYETPCIFLEKREEGLLVIAKEQIKTIFGNSNNFANSSLANFLNGKYLNELTCGNSGDKYIVSRDVDLTALNGSKEYGHYECKVAPLTFDEIRRFHGLLPKPESWEWGVTPMNSSSVDGENTWVVGLNADGDISSIYCANTHECRPAFVISHEYFKDNKKGLSQYSTIDLIVELYKRHSES